MTKIATLTQNNGETTLTLEYTYPNATMLKYLTAWAKYDFLRGYGAGDFDAMSNQEKIDMILARVFDVGKAEAVAQIETDAIPDPVVIADSNEINAME